MAKKTKKDLVQPEMENAPPLPVEAEEASHELKWGQLAAVVFAVVFLALLIMMVLTTVMPPWANGQWYGLIGMAYFAVGGVFDIALAASARGGALLRWREGRFVDSDKFLGGWREVMAFIVGGIVPGFFLHRAVDRIQPLVELERGGVPAVNVGAYPGSYPSGAGGYPSYPGPAPGPASAPAPSAPSPAPMPMAPPMPSGPMAPGPGPSAAPSGAPYSDTVAPDPMGGSRPAARPSGSPWSRPATSSSIPPSASARYCSACQAPLDAGATSCRACGAPANP